MHGFLISAAHKSSGKTTVSIGLAAALAAQGRSVQPFKKGPDYIDPLWLGMAAGRACRNLDFNLSPPEELRAYFARHGSGAEVCLVEGNKGLYDGLDLEGRNSNAALARLLGLPVILVLDARGMTRGIAPLILGYQAFDPNVRIAGVVLNRLGGARHEAKLRAVIEHYTDVPVIGAVHEDAAISLTERHLGLIPANESVAARERIDAIALRVRSQVDLALLERLTLADAPRTARFPVRRASARVRIAVARDRAFGFYYADDLDGLEAAGAQILPFDTLSDTRLPAADGLFIGGGFPESFLDALERNAALRADIRARIASGLPTYAECGGLMYLARSITWKGSTRRMVGALEADVVMHPKPVGRGYVRLAETADHPWGSAAVAGREIPAHEFHYSAVDNLPADARYAYRVLRGHGVDGRHDGLVFGSVLASYSHLRSTPGNDWAARFVAHVDRCARSHAAAASVPR